MKKITILAAVVALLGSCAQNTEDTINPNTKVEGRTIYATFDNEEEETKTYVENYKYLRWHAGDEISFFDATTHNSQYAFAGNDGDAEGEFNVVATGEGTAIATTYGVYPYNAKTSISEEGVISVELPAIQAYGVNSFGKGANTMVAVGERATDDKLFFKNACGYLVVKLYNESGAAVKSAVLKGNNEEKISGAATITATHAGIPSVAMADTATTAVTIDCGEGVEIGTTAETATEFWFVLPEITFEGGITITATDTEGKEYEKTTTKPVVITRNNVQPMKALGAFFMPHIIPETWKIYYTATTKIEKQSWSKTTFGASIVSNEWDSATGEGVITLDGEVTMIGERAFDWDTNLTGIIIPNSVTSIGGHAFYGCVNLTSSITIPSNVENIGDSAFFRCKPELKVFDNAKQFYYSPFSGCEGTLIIDMENVPNGSYWDDADNDPADFLMYSGFSKVVLSENVKTIGNLSFYGLPIKELEINSNITVNNGSAPFSYCILKNVVINNPTSSIDKALFAGCTNLVSVTIPNSVTTIGEGAFEGCTNLEEVHISEVSAWCQVKFGNMYSNPVYYADYLYTDDRLVTDIVIPNGVTSIIAGAFYGIKSIESVTIPDSVTSIGGSAFYGCSNIREMTLGKGITSIGQYAFVDCGKTFGGHLYVNCGTTFNEKGGYKATSREHWLYGSSFTFITIGDNVKSIGKYAFYGYPTVTVATIGSNVSTINRGAFWNCSNLQTILCKPINEPYIYYNASYNEGSFPFNTNMTIGVPQESYQYYTIWGNYVSGSVAVNNWYVYKSYLRKTSF